MKVIDIKELRNNKDKKYILSWALTIIIAMPLLWSQLKTSQVSSRGNLSPLEYLFSRPALPTDSFFGSLIFPGLLGFVSFSGFLFRFGAVHYFGTLFALLFFGGGIILLGRHKRKSLKKISPLFWCGLVSMILSWGIFGIIYSFGLLIPFFNSFLALCFSSPLLVNYLPNSINTLSSLEDVIKLLNRIISDMDIDVGASFKAVSYSGDMKKNNEDIYEWEMSHSIFPFSAWLYYTVI